MVYHSFVQKLKLFCHLMTYYYGLFRQLRLEVKMLRTMQELNEIFSFTINEFNSEARVKEEQRLSTLYFETWKAKAVVEEWEKDHKERIEFC